MWNLPNICWKMERNATNHVFMANLREQVWTVQFLYPLMCGPYTIDSVFVEISVLDSYARKGLRECGPYPWEMYPHATVLFTFSHQSKKQYAVEWPAFYYIEDLSYDAQRSLLPLMLNRVSYDELPPLINCNRMPRRICSTKPFYRTVRPSLDGLPSREILGIFLLHQMKLVNFTPCLSASFFFSFLFVNCKYASVWCPALAELDKSRVRPRVRPSSNSSLYLRLRAPVYY